MNKSLLISQAIDCLLNYDYIYQNQGCNCKFFAMTEYLGIKMYNDSNRRDWAFKVQEDFYQLKAAPEPICCFSYRNKFCYITESVLMYTSIIIDNILNCKQSKVYNKYKLLKIDHYFSHLQWIANLLSYKSDLGTFGLDICYDNVGFNDTGIVLVDFDNFRKKEWN